jgi:hypothetical protein
MAKPEIIHCIACTAPCGKVIPADDTDPSYCEGVGENFTTAEGDWCCSQKCLDIYNVLYLPIAV